LRLLLASVIAIAVAVSIAALIPFCGDLAGSAPAIGLTPSTGDSAAPSDSSSVAAERERAILPALDGSTPDSGLTVSVREPSGSSVPGARVTISRVSYGVRECMFSGLADSGGTLSVPTVPSGTCSVMVTAPRFLPWFREAAISGSMTQLEVVMDAGMGLSGVVLAGSRPLAGTVVRLVADPRGKWPTADFLSEAIWPQNNLTALTPDSQMCDVSATTDAEGGFEFRGLAASWQCVVAVDDAMWAASPPFLTVKPGDRDVKILVGAATTLQFRVQADGDRADALPGGSMDLLVSVGDASGDSRSFAMSMHGGAGSLRFIPPTKWSGSLLCEAVARAGSWSASSGPVTVAIGGTSWIDLSPSRDASGWCVVLDPEWHDGSLCDAGVSVRAYADSGQPIGVSVSRAHPQGYVIRAESRPRRLEWLASDCLRDWSDAPVVDVASAPIGSRLRTSMPRGADLLVTVPDVSTNVLLEGPFGARSLTVNRTMRFRSVVSGDYSARADLGGSPVRRSVSVVGTTPSHLNFLQ